MSAIAASVSLRLVGGITPESWLPALGDAEHGFPYLSGAGRLVIKDVLLLARGPLAMADSAHALLAGWRFVPRSRRSRNEWNLQQTLLTTRSETLDDASYGVSS
jgi:Protein of unknown function, DUF417